MIRSIKYIILFFFLASFAFGSDRNIYIASETDPSEDGSITHPYDSFTDINWAPNGSNSIYDWVAAGDTVYINLAKGDIFRESLTIGASGVPGRPITIQGNDNGGGNANPVIFTTQLYDSSDFGTPWYDSDGKKIYRIKVPNDYIWEIAVDGTRVPYYPTTNHRDIINHLKDGHVAYKRAKGDHWIYYRKDFGKVGSVEVPARLNAIYANTKSYIMLDGIDTFGGAACNSPVSDTTLLSQVLFTSSSGNYQHITVKNSEHSSGAIGVSFRLAGSGTANDLMMDNIYAHHNRYYQAYAVGTVTNDVYDSQTMDGLTIQNSEFAYCADVPSDAGDQECGAVRRVKNILFTNNYIHDNGYDFSTGYKPTSDPTNSSLFTFIENYNTVSSYNYFYNAAGTGTLYAEAGIYHVASCNVTFMYNIIDTWGRYNTKHSYGDTAVLVGSRKKCLSDGKTYIPMGNVRIYNNLFINGPSSHDSYNFKENFSVISLTNSDYDLIDITNNIAENIPNDDMPFLFIHYHDDNPIFLIRNNIIHKTSGKAFIHHDGTYWNYNKVGDTKQEGYFGYDDYQDVLASGNINSDPNLSSKTASPVSSKYLLFGSPAIDKGVTLNQLYDNGLNSGTTWHPVSIMKTDQDSAGIGWEIGPYVYTGSKILEVQ